MEKSVESVEPAHGDRKDAKRLAERLNIPPIGAFCIWLAAFVLFWANALGPLRDFDTPPPATAAWPWLAGTIVAGVLAHKRFELPIVGGEYHRRTPIPTKSTVSESC